MGANVLRGQVSQDLGRLFVMRVSVLCCPIAQNSHSPFSPNVALKNLPAGQHRTRPGLLKNSASVMTFAHSVEHQIRVKFSAFLNMLDIPVDCRLIPTCFTVHLEMSTLNEAAPSNTTYISTTPESRKQWTRKQ